MTDYSLCKKATYLPDLFEDGNPTISPEEIDAYIDLNPEKIDASIDLKPEDIYAYIGLEPDEIYAYINLKPEVVDATICITGPAIESLTALWYVFDDTAITIDGMVFSYITFK